MKSGKKPGFFSGLNNACAEKQTAFPMIKRAQNDNE